MLTRRAGFPGSLVLASEVPNAGHVGSGMSSYAERETLSCGRAPLAGQHHSKEQFLHSGRVAVVLRLAHGDATAMADGATQIAFALDMCPTAFLLRGESQKDKILSLRVTQGVMPPYCPGPSTLEVQALSLRPSHPALRAQLSRARRSASRVVTSVGDFIFMQCSDWWTCDCAARE